MGMENVLAKGTLLRGNSYNYVIEKFLGQGSFGITYLATTKVKVGGALGSLETTIKVAVKEFFMKDINDREGSTVTCGSKGGLYDNYKAKFKKEATNLSNLHHPGIVKVLELFEANNTFYYAMEYCEGGSLDSKIMQGGRMPVQQCVRYAAQIASALTYMHRNNMLHLDLKPSNIMLRASGEAVLIDFGLSKQYDENGNPENSTTIGGGTPGYAPLEQSGYHEGKGFPVTMDVYALGGTLFKMLTGVKPPTASDIFNKLRNLEELEESAVSSGVAAVIRKAMSPAIGERYKSVKELILSLKNAADEAVGKEDDVVVVVEKPYNSTSDMDSNATQSENPPSKGAVNGTNGFLQGNVMMGILLGAAQALFALSWSYLSYGGVESYETLDSDGRMATLFFIVSLFVARYLLKRFNKRIDTQLWNLIKWGVTAAGILNTLMLGMWNHSLTFAYLVLSLALAYLSAYMFSVKR